MDAPILEPGPVLRVDRSATLDDEPWWLSLVGAGTEERRWRVAATGLTFDALVVDGSGPALVLLPHLEGTDRVARYVARRFSRSGFQVLAVLPPPGALQGDPSADRLVQILHERVRVGRLAVRLAASDLGASCIVLLGLSVGALAAVPVAALEPRVDGVIAALGGADLGIIASESSEPLLRPKGNAAEGGKPIFEDSEAARRVDPLSWSAWIDPRRVLLLSARWDQVIPEAARRALRQSLGDPREVVFPAGHYSFAAFLPIAVSESIEHARAICPVATP